MRGRPFGKGSDNNTYGKGYGKSYKGGAPSGYVDRFPRVAEKLEMLRDNLPTQAAKAYHALQLALQPHSRAYGSRPHFEDDFHTSLRSLFPDAGNITARQIGSWNQWEVRIDDGPAIYCSVRLEVLSDDQSFVQDLKSKSRIVKETLLENHGKWKKDLQPGKDFNFEKHNLFERECHERIARSTQTAGSRREGSRERQSAWQDDKAKCKLCGKYMDEDQLAGHHMCVVFGFFQCPQCRATWTSHHARLKPDGETIMGQKCSRCRCNGVAKDWHVNTGRDAMDDASIGGKSQSGRGMHQSELCDACREFGNCMGVFYDPFVLTTALSLVSGQWVQWRSFSETMPELLIADLGPDFKDLQVCLQPHVYVAPSDEDEDSSFNYASVSRHAAGGGSGNSFRGKGSGGSQHHDYDRNARYDNDEYDDNEEDEDEEFVVPRGKREEARRRERDLAFDAPLRESGGVKDTTLFNSFLNKVDARAAKQQDLPSNPTPAPGSGNLEKAPPPPISENQTSIGKPSDFLGAPSAADTAAIAASSNSQAASHGPAADTVPKFKWKNKIKPTSPVAEASGPPTPLLDALPPLRRAQFLQIVLRHVKASGDSESDKQVKAEEYLRMCDGDYEVAYEKMKALMEGLATD